MYNEPYNGGYGGKYRKRMLFIQPWTSKGKKWDGRINGPSISTPYQLFFRPNYAQAVVQEQNPDADFLRSVLHLQIYLSKIPFAIKNASSIQQK